MNFFFIAVQCFFKIKGLNQPWDFMFTCQNYEIATYIVKYKSAQSCKSKVTGSVSLRCWPEVLLCGVAERAGYDIKRSNPLSSARSLSSEGLVLRHLRECVNGIYTLSLDLPHKRPVLFMSCKY